MDEVVAVLDRLESDEDPRAVTGFAIQRMMLLAERERRGLTSSDSALLDSYVKQLPRADFRIYRYQKEGRSYAEIAELMNISVEAVVQSLVATLSNARVLLYGLPEGPDGGGEPGSDHPDDPASGPAAGEPARPPEICVA